MKYFIITIDTEGDNLWEYKQGGTIYTQNARYIPRFQELCQKYNFKPVYLMNYEMAHDDFFVDFANQTLNNNKCEIGIHIHAWNNPPNYELEKRGKKCGLPYLIEYPKNIMREKIDIMYNLLKEKFNADIVTHRSGRWAMNQDYFDLLIERGIKMDCSVTPHYSWRNTRGYSPGSAGSDYSGRPETPFFVQHSNLQDKILEIPMSVRVFRRLQQKRLSIRGLASQIKTIFFGSPVWLRPRGNNLQDMLFLVDYEKKSCDEYIMFMLHSSELMPGGSPTFRNAESIENLYNHLEILFSIISKDFQGITLKDYYSHYIKSQ
jgi:hypothetical protein